MMIVSADLLGEDDLLNGSDITKHYLYGIVSDINDIL
jgi:hypothetical protein